MSKKVRAIIISAVCVILICAIALSVAMCGSNKKQNKKAANSSTSSPKDTVSTTDDTVSALDQEIDLGDLDSIIDIGDYPFDIGGPMGDTDMGEGNLSDGYLGDLNNDELQPQLPDEESDNSEDDSGYGDDLSDIEDLSYGKYESVIQCTGNAVSGSKRKIEIDNTRVVWEDFYGFGTNVMTSAMVDPERIYYNEPMFEFDMNREKVLYPQVIRLVFQLDYMVTSQEEDPYRRDVKNNKDYQNYLNGIYSFDNENMQSMYAYLDKYKEMGTEILVDFGWKTNSRITNWYALPVFLPTASAPYDLRAYAKACVAMYENFIDRGYDNVKYITFFNEPQNSEDFLTLGDSVTWYAKMVSLMDEEFKKAGLREDVELWGPEQGQTTIKYYPYLKDFATFDGVSEDIDYWSIHRYYKGKENFENNYYEYFNDMLLFINEFGKRICSTEMQAFGGPGEECQEAIYTDWNDTYSSYLIASLNVGVKNVCCWGFCDYYWSFPINGWIGGFIYTHTEGNVDNVTKVSQAYQEIGLLTNYVTPHCDVLMSDWTGDDIRVSAVRLRDGNYTVLVETMGGDDKYDIDVSFAEAINKTFYRFSTDRLEELTEDYTLPGCNKVFQNVTTKLSDTLDGKNASLYVYTTKKPLKQIALNDYSVKIKYNETFNFNATLLDCEAEEIEWSISAATGKGGTITSTGAVSAVYTPADGVASGDMVSIRATLKSDPGVYTTALVQIN